MNKPIIDTVPIGLHHEVLVRRRDGGKLAYVVSDRGASRFTAIDGQHLAERLSKDMIDFPTGDLFWQPVGTVYQGGAGVSRMGGASIKPVTSASYRPTHGGYPNAHA